MHIFLTGEIQIGKSTIINKVLRELGVIPGGFLTYYGCDRACENRSLYICGAWESKCEIPTNQIVQFTNGIPAVNTDKFNTYGSQLIRESRKRSSIIIMDECGTLESQALEFQAEVLDCLNGSIPVLGVIKKSERLVWTEQIKSHPNVEVLFVDKSNRDQLPEEIIKQLK